MGKVDLRRNRKSTKGAAILIDKDTFCEQIRLHEKAMYYLAFSLVQNEADAADVIGEAMLMYGKEASNRKQEIDRQHYTIPNQRPKDKHCGKI